MNDEIENSQTTSGDAMQTVERLLQEAGRRERVMHQAATARVLRTDLLAQVARRESDRGARRLGTLVAALTLAAVTALPGFAELAALGDLLQHPIAELTAALSSGAEVPLVLASVGGVFLLALGIVMLED